MHNISGLLFGKQVLWFDSRISFGVIRQLFDTIPEPQYKLLRPMFPYTILMPEVALIFTK